MVKKIYRRLKMKELLFHATVGNFIGFLMGSLVARITTYTVYEQDGLTNLFGILPRKKIEHHLMPKWAETSLAIIVGFVVMELISYFLNQKIYMLIWNKLRNKEPDTKGNNNIE